MSDAREGVVTPDQQVETPGRSANGLMVTLGLWVVQVLLAAAMVGAGLAKLSGAAEMVTLFDAVGAGQWLRVVTGALEVGGGALLLVPALAGMAALALAGVLSGAVLTELLVLPDGNALKPLPLLLLALIVLYGRRHTVIRLLVRGRTRRVLQTREGPWD
ncbi:MAG: DoxX family protein [Longimicrobiales bacterium]|nr:DoxX family protein [Longimicrobiales bacterium]